MGSLEDMLAEPARTHKGPKCHTGIALLNLTDERRALVIRCIGDPAYPDTQVAEALDAVSDVRVAKQSVMRHRNGDCACPDDLRP